MFFAEYRRREGQRKLTSFRRRELISGGRPSSSVIAPTNPATRSPLCLANQNRPNMALTNRDCFGDGGKVDGRQRHRAYFSDCVEFRTLPRVLSQASAVSW